MPILAVDELTKRFGPNEVLKSVSLSLDAQEIRAICGENGAGKSTLVKCIMGYYHATAGDIVIGGREQIIANPKNAHALGLGPWWRQGARPGVPGVRDVGE